jgi:hypothetical protein
LATGGRQRSAAEPKRLLIGTSFGDGRWVWLDGGHHGIGLVIAEKV